MDVQTYMHGVGRQARAASRVIARAGTAVKNLALTETAAAIERSQQALLDANVKDVTEARHKQLADAAIDRLILTPKTIAAMADGLLQIAKLPDPVGEISGLKYRPSGIQVGQMRVPLGVVGIIYESRPNVTADAAGLCLKSGNAAILRGGSEALHSNQAIAACVREGLAAAGLPETAVQVIETSDRAAVGELITLREFVDVIVPRGGKSLVARVQTEARVPVFAHLEGICHTYVHAKADPTMARTVTMNANLSDNIFQSALTGNALRNQILVTRNGGTVRSEGLTDPILWQLDNRSLGKISVNVGSGVGTASTTGNAGGSHNLSLTSSQTRSGDDLQEMLRKLGTGLFVVELMGQGVNPVTGDYSRGASGFWVEKGRIAYPVQEITIAGNLTDMYRGILAVGSDAYNYGAKTVGSVLINRMKIAGS